MLINDYVLINYPLSIAAVTLLFCMLAATDPVTVSSVFSKFKVPHRLKILTEGESLFNDAAALKAAEIGVAIGTGSDLTIESADIIISKGDISKILVAINLSKLTFKKIKQNLFWAFIYNIIAIPMAMMSLLHPVIAEAAMLLSSINVIYNSGRIKKMK